MSVIFSQPRRSETVLNRVGVVSVTWPRVSSGVVTEVAGQLPMPLNFNYQKFVGNIFFSENGRPAMQI